MNTSECSGLSERARLKLFRLREIAPPAGMAREIIRIAGDDQVELDEVVAVIERSPETAVRILRCANSAYYGQRGRIDTVREAVIRVLGLSVSKSLMLAMALSGAFQLRECPGFSRERHWFVAVAAASLSRDLAPHLLTTLPPSSSTAYTAGLLHNLGIFALVHGFPQEMTQVFSEPEASRREQLQERLVGLDAGTAGHWLAERWGLPSEMALVMAYHKNPGYRGASWPLAHLVGLGAAVAERLFEQKDPEEALPCWTEDFLSPHLVKAAAGRLALERQSLLDLADLLTGKGG